MVEGMLEIDGIVLENFFSSDVQLPVLNKEMGDIDLEATR